MLSRQRWKKKRPVKINNCSFGKITVDGKTKSYKIFSSNRVK